MFHAFFRSTLPVLPLLLVLSPVNASSCAMRNKPTEIRVKYENILSHDINELAEENNTAVELASIVILMTSEKVEEKTTREDKLLIKYYHDHVMLLRPSSVIPIYKVNMSAEYPDRCCTNTNENIKVFFCNDTELWFLPNILMLLLLLLKIAALNISKRWQEIESLQSMACNMLRFFNKQRISKAFRWKAAFVSCGTLKVLQCKCERPKKEKVCPDVFNTADTETGEQSKKKCNQEVCELKENISSLRSCWNKFEKIISR